MWSFIKRVIKFYCEWREKQLLKEISKRLNYR